MRRSRIVVKLGVSSQMCAVLHSMYRQAQSVVCTSSGCTEQIQCDKGVRQGRPLSPTLFALYMNDLMSEMSGSGVKLVNQNVKGLMYADDVALVAESGADLQSMLDSLSAYGDKWSLCVNTKKSIESWCLVVVGLMQVFSSHTKGLSWSWWITLDTLG